MIVKLDKERKIVLLQALQSGEIETDIVESWNGDIKAMTQNEIDDELLKCERATAANIRLCKMRVNRRICPYQYLNLAAIDNGVDSQMVADYKQYYNNDGL